MYNVISTLEIMIAILENLPTKGLLFSQRVKHGSRSHHRYHIVRAKSFHEAGTFQASRKRSRRTKHKDKSYLTIQIFTMLYAMA